MTPKERAEKWLRDYARMFYPYAAEPYPPDVVEAAAEDVRNTCSAQWTPPDVREALLPVLEELEELL